jgi:outer membrane protein OmpA-like peptidoglycan-associated protein
MAGTFWKWLIPGIVTVAGGTVLALAQTNAAVTSDLGARASAVLDPAHFAWATVAIDGRDLVLSGTATTQKSIDDAVAKVATLRGVRAVDNHVALAEFVSPFPFAATLKAGKITLTGAYPDEGLHTALIAAAGKPTDQTGLFSGAPDGFEGGARFALSALTQLDEGEVRLADLSLTISGRAKSPAAFESLQRLPNSLPPGVQLASLTVTPPIASPFIWTAKFDGTKVAISGDTPSTTLGEQLRAITPANVPVLASLQLASGEPSGFSSNTLVLLGSLLKLESGEASISDGTIALSGAPSTPAVGDDVTAAITKIGGTVTLEPPRVADYAMSVEKAGDKLIIAGFVPDKASRDQLAALPGADISKLALGRGAPEGFASAMEFGLSAIGHFADGRFEIKGGRISIGGRATTVADFKAVSDLIAQGAPEGLTLTAAEIHPPVAEPFIWSAVKDASGQIALAGFVPNEKVRATLQGKIASLATDAADPADGAPDNFAFSAQKGLEILGLLDSGTLKFDGANWSIDGTVSDTRKGFAADAAYSVAGLRTMGWSYAVHLPAAPAMATLPTIAPYVWRAQKTADGAISFSGFAPAEAFQVVARSRAAGAIDATVLGAGAPADFGTSALAGLDALQALDEGALSLSGTRWTLNGVTTDSGTRGAIQDKLSAAINAANWQIAIQAKDAAPIVTPYLWSATKSPEGVELSGYVPNDELKALTEKNAGTVTRDSIAIASGEPPGFAEDLAAALEALTHLSDGKAAFDGSKWMLTGIGATPADADAAVAALTKGSKGGGLWSNSIAGQTPPPSSAPASEPPSQMSSAEDISSLASPSSSEEVNRDLSTESDASGAPSSADFPSTPLMEPKAESSSSAETPSASSTEPATAIVTVAPMPDALAFEATKPHGKPIALRGKVPAEAAQAYFASIAGDVKTDDMLVSPGLPDDFITNAIAGINALTSLSEGRLGFDGTRWWLRGKAETKAASDTISASIAALPNGKDWSVTIDLLAAIDVCSDKVAGVAERNGILFEPGKSVLMKVSIAVLDELAGDLQVCPNTYVHVQGHTDGDGDPDVNLALSVARAETVVAELIKRGVAESRLYAEGYGESDPIVANDTKANKAKNRRIAFTITQE